MTTPKISLIKIEEAIKANCIVDKKSEKPLMLAVDHKGKHNNRGVGRVLFIYFALQCGYSKADVVAFIDIEETEWKTRTEQFENLYYRGKELFYDRARTDELSLFFYRKLRLIANHLQLTPDYTLS